MVDGGSFSPLGYASRRDVVRDAFPFGGHNHILRLHLLLGIWHENHSQGGEEYLFHGAQIDAQVHSKTKFMFILCIWTWREAMTMSDKGATLTYHTLYDVNTN